MNGTVGDLMEKAARAVASARLLLEARDTGKAINDAQEIRQLADYLPADVSDEKAEWAVLTAAAFVAEISALPAIAAPRS